MHSFARAVGSFLVLMAIGYLAVVLLLPAPNSALTRPDDVLTGRSVADQLTDQARSLEARKALRVSQ